jgi:peroxiredoxin
VLNPWLKNLLPTALAIAAALCHFAAAAETPSDKQAADHSPAAICAAFGLADTSGEKHSAAEWRGKKAVVVFFIAAECPVSNFYSPDFARIAREYAAKGVAVYGVHCDEDLTAADAAKHAKEYGLKFPVLLDPQQKFAAAVGARKTPEAFVLAPDGKVLYHGRIDDRFALNGKRRDEPTRHELEDAIRAVLDEKTPAVKEAAPYGCPLPSH